MAVTLARIRKAKQLADRRTPMAVPADAPTSTWKPFPGKPQEVAYDLDRVGGVDEMFMGGAAGAGKSGLIVGVALTKHRRSLILRREATQLKELACQLREFAPPGSRWRGVGYGGLLTTSDGREIELSGVPNEEDKRRFQGRPHDLVAFDEATEFSESIVDFVGGWNRTSVPGQHCFTLLTGNPPTHSSGAWIIRRYAPWVDPTHGDRARPGEVRWYARIGDDEEQRPDGTPFQWKGYTIRPRSRTFVPGRVEDNPILSQTDYPSRLAALPGALRDALLLGDFGVALRDDPWQVIPTPWIKAAQARWTKTPPADTPLTMAGLDIAYGGSDRTVLVRRFANWIGMPDVWSGAETDSGEKAAALVLPKLAGSMAPVNCDVIGVGTAAYESLGRLKANAVPVNFGSGAQGRTDKRNVLTFVNTRAAAYWFLRDALDPDLGSEMALPPDPDLLAELAAARFEMVGGRLKIEAKEDIIERLGRSPDKADAVVLATYEPPVTFWFSQH